MAIEIVGKLLEKVESWERVDVIRSSVAIKTILVFLTAFSSSDD